MLAPLPHDDARCALSREGAVANATRLPSRRGRDADEGTGVAVCDGVDLLRLHCPSSRRSVYAEEV